MMTRVFLLVFATCVAVMAAGDPALEVVGDEVPSVEDVLGTAVSEEPAPTQPRLEDLVGTWRWNRRFSHITGMGLSEQVVTIYKNRDGYYASYVYKRAKRVRLKPEPEKGRPFAVKDEAVSYSGLPVSLDNGYVLFSIPDTDESFTFIFRETKEGAALQRVPSKTRYSAPDLLQISYFFKQKAE